MTTNPGTVTPRTVWRVMFVMFALTIGILLVFVHFGVRHPLAPWLAPWLLVAGLILAFPGLVAPMRIRLMLGRAAGTEGHAATTRLITACSLAELPALTGAAYYLLSGEPRGTGLLVLISVALLARLHPPR